MSNFDAFLTRAVDAHMAGNDEADELAYELAWDDAKNQEAAAQAVSEDEAVDVAALALRLYKAKRADRAGIAADFAEGVLASFERALDRIAQDTAERFIDDAIEDLRERAAP